MLHLLILLVICCTDVLLVLSENSTENDLKKYLDTTFEKEASNMCYKRNIAEFNFETDIKNKTAADLNEKIILEASAWEKRTWEDHYKNLTISDCQNTTLKRILKILKNVGIAILEPEKLTQFTNVTNEMVAIYSTAKICPYKNQNCNLSSEGLSLEPGIEAVMSQSKDYDELLYVWKAWRDASGAKIKKLFPTYVNLSNEAAKLNNFSDKGASWTDTYEDDHFVEKIDALWKEVEPLYSQLVTYVGKKLKQRYGDKLDMSDGLLPAHIFGNMWAQEWNNLADLVKPYPNVSQIDWDKLLVNRGYTIYNMFNTANEFYTSLGLLDNSMCYDEAKGALIKKPQDGREVLCHASAWDFCDGETYRLKMCTKLVFEDFVTIHHEMGHIQYFQQYKDQPFFFRQGANPGFHEAIGDTIALSVSTPKHLVKIGLLTNYTDTAEAHINSLMDMALRKIAFLPFGLIIDKWRWDVFRGTVNESQWNSHWWEYREKYQKIKAPTNRSDETDLDPAAKFHVAGDSQYIAYFVAHILQFQFYKSLCIAAHEYDPNNKTAPLSNCDFYQSKNAGDVLKKGLSLGLRDHWNDVLFLMTGTTELSAQPLLEYFEPLKKFLEEQNSG